MVRVQGRSEGGNEEGWTDVTSAHWLHVRKYHGEPTNTDNLGQ